MDPLSAGAAFVGLTLALAGTFAIVAWRHERTHARIPAVLLGLAVAVLAIPAVVDTASEELEPDTDTITVDDTGPGR